MPKKKIEATYNELVIMQESAQLRGILDFYDYDEEKEMFFVMRGDDHEVLKPLNFTEGR